jgi:hypothetical protein
MQLTFPNIATLYLDIYTCAGLPTKGNVASRLLCGNKVCTTDSYVQVISAHRAIPRALARFYSGFFEVSAGARERL